MTKDTRTRHIEELRKFHTTTADYALHRATCEACKAGPPIKVALDLRPGDRIDRIGWTPVRRRRVTRVQVDYREGEEPTVRFWFTEDAHPEAGALMSTGSWWTPVDMLEAVPS